MTDNERELQECLANPELVQLKDIAEEYGINYYALRQRIKAAKIKAYEGINLGDGKGNYVFYNKSKVLLVIGDNFNAKKRKELQECLDNPELVQLKDVAEEYKIAYNTLYGRLISAGIKYYKFIRLGIKGHFAFWNKSEVLSVIQDKISEKEQRERKTFTLNNANEADMQNKEIPLIYGRIKVGSQIENEEIEMEKQPDIIPADTLDIYTLKQLQDRLEYDGVTFNQDIYNFIASSDDEVYRQIQDMIEGKSRDVVLSGSKIRDVVEELKRKGTLNGAERLTLEQRIEKIEQTNKEIKLLLHKLIEKL